ncbi:MAG: phosphatidylglycerophosphatase A [Gammaproteobacteria bacterium]|nr:phosphatidylglycerophosphatase A [Gammaproteobacteria bacterium]
MPIFAKPPVRPDWSNPVHLLAFGLGSGSVPYAPGTVGTVAALPLYFLIRPLSAEYYLLVVLVLFVFGIWVCGRVSKDLGVHDHGGIVWDEWVGLLITLWLCPAGWVWILVGFALFRLFDILKPWPISWLDRELTGGLGVMTDDLIAGVFGFLVLQAMARLWS